MLKPVESQTSAPTQINVVLNWFEELKRRVPVKYGIGNREQKGSDEQEVQVLRFAQDDSHRGH